MLALTLNRSSTFCTRILTRGQLRVESALTAVSLSEPSGHRRRGEKPRESPRLTPERGGEAANDSPVVETEGVSVANAAHSGSVSPLPFGERTAEELAMKVII